MANGLPVITTDKCVAGLELVENNVNGYIVPAEDVKALSEKISSILDNNSQRNAMANKCLEKYGIIPLKIWRRHTLRFCHEESQMSEVVRRGGG